MRILVPLAFVAAALLLQGCVSTAIGAAGAAVGAGVEVTGKTAGAAKDVVFFAPAEAR
jgi:predicted small secreted protein